MHDGTRWSLIATSTLIASGVLAGRPRVGAREAAVFRWFNDGPEVVRRPAWLVMQVGSLGAVGVATGLTAVRHGRGAAGPVLAAGVAAWTGVKLVKPLVGRGRPAACLDDVIVRGPQQHGLGFPSGHAAVATALALRTTTAGPARIVASTVAAGAGCGRMYTGAHLPLDVVGGLAFGVLVHTLTGDVT